MPVIQSLPFIFIKDWSEKGNKLAPPNKNNQLFRHEAVIPCNSCFATKLHPQMAVTATSANDQNLDGFKFGTNYPFVVKAF